MSICQSQFNFGLNSVMHICKENLWKFSISLNFLSICYVFAVSSFWRHVHLRCLWTVCPARLCTWKGGSALLGRAALWAAAALSSALNCVQANVVVVYHVVIVGNKQGQVKVYFNIKGIYYAVRLTNINHAQFTKHKFLNVDKVLYFPTCQVGIP